MKPVIAVALSGGVDSLTAAYLLKSQGCRIFGIHFVTGYETQYPISHLTDQLGIDIEKIDCSAAFQSEVVDYFIRTYQAGKTPNPCLICNASIKFGIVLNLAKQRGAVALATGHYARIIKSPLNFLDKDKQEGTYHLLRGVDVEKDQSYFLALLTQKHLASAIFPLGEMTKADVRRIASEKGLVPAIKEESQDVCFIKEKTYSDFLSSQKGFQAKPGVIEDINGKYLGEHNGLYRFTIGQRRGINCPASEPYYVIRIDIQRNCLVVGFKKDLLTSESKIIHINWIGYPPIHPIPVYTRVRYRHKAVPSTLFPIDDHTAYIRFDAAQSAITPGQGAVFYRGDEVLGGGLISESL